MRIRITKAPDPDEFAEFDLRAFRVGDVFEVPPQLATLLTIAGNAEPVPSINERAVAADSAPKKRR